VSDRAAPARTRRRVPVAVAAAALVAVAAGGIALRSSPAGMRSAASAGVPPPVAPAFVPGPPRRLTGTRYLSHWAPVRHVATVHAGPGVRTAVVTTLLTQTPEGTRNAVALIPEARPPGAWVHVRLPILPNGTTGWVRRSALGGYETVHTRLVVDLHALRATLYRDGRAVLRAPVGVGMPGWGTPRGEFYVRNKLTRYSSPVYGPVAFGTSARSPHATDWPAGGFVGIHGTNAPELIPGRISHGCIRMRNADSLALAREMPVGTPLTIR
jgi:L,D-transpeptidase catalytic domain